MSAPAATAGAIPEVKVDAAPAKPSLWRQPRVQKAAFAMAVVAVILAAVWWVRFRPYVSTEDARVAAPVASVAPQGGGGRVERVVVREGARVHAGDALVMLDDRAERAQRDRARAALTLAEARVREAEEGLALERRLASSSEERARAGVQSARASLALTAHGPRREEVERARASLTAAEARASEAHAAFERAEALSRDGAIAASALDQARASDAQAREAARSARATLEQLQRGARSEEIAVARGGVAQAEAQLSEAEAGADRVALRERQVEEARAAAAQARAELTAAEVALDRTVLRSAIDGVVLRVGVDPGDFVSTGQAAVTVADVDHAWIAANIEETAVGEVHRGQGVEVSVDEGGTLRGHVDVVTQSAASQFALIPADNASGNFTKVVQRIPIRVALDGAPSRPLRVGQSVELRIRVR